MQQRRGGPIIDGMRFAASLLSLASLTASAEQLWLERFEAPSAASYPEGWEHGNEKDGKSDYFLVREGGNSFLRGSFLSGTEGKVIYRKMSWDSDKFHFLRWRWRVNRFPKGAKILESDKSDAAAQVYVTWRISNRNYALKYFWSESDPVGTGFHHGKWNLFGRYWGEVIRMGGATGLWQTEKRNIHEDFLRVFGKDHPQMTAGIGVLTDGDQTGTNPEADYDDFEALTE